MIIASQIDIDEVNWDRIPHPRDSDPTSVKDIPHTGKEQKLVRLKKQYKYSTARTSGTLPDSAPVDPTRVTNGRPDPTGRLRDSQRASREKYATELRQVLGVHLRQLAAIAPDERLPTLLIEVYPPLAERYTHIDHDTERPDKWPVLYSAAGRSPECPHQMHWDSSSGVYRCLHNCGEADETPPGVERSDE